MGDEGACARRRSPGDSARARATLCLFCSNVAPSERLLRWGSFGDASASDSRNFSTICSLRLLFFFLHSPIIPQIGLPPVAVQRALQPGVSLAVQLAAQLSSLSCRSFSNGDPED